MTYFKAILLIVCLGLIPKLALHSATLPQSDANGYTSQYIRPLLNDGDICASGYDCVQKPTSCDQTISTTTETSWPSLTGNVICLESDDHTSRGDLILTSSGTIGSGNECSTWKWLILDINDLGYDAYPWNVGEASKAKVQRIEMNDQDCWVIHRLTFSKEQVDSKIVTTGSSSDNIIVDSNLFEKNKGNTIGAIHFNGSKYLNIQNNVVRNCVPVIGYVQQSINVTPDSDSTDNFVVNNELYDCGSMTTSDEVSDPAINFVIENNDMYLTDTSYYDGSGNPDITGPNSMTANVSKTRVDGDQTYPFLWLHNRIWGLKPCDTNVACNAFPPQAINIAGSVLDQKTADWLIVKNNIVADGEVGFGCNVLTDGASTGCDRISLIGNIFYNNNFQTTDRIPGGIKTYNENADTNDNWEIYLNTFIYNKDDASNEGGWLQLEGTDDADIRCNVVIDSDYDTAGTSAVLTNNVYYNSEDAGEGTKQTHSTSVRINSTDYFVGDIIRTSDDPINDCNSKTDSDCFLYRVIKDGTSFTSPVTYCTQLGCETDDGTTTVRAIRGPYVYRRKLLTVSSGEEAFVPFAAVDTQAPEANPPYCPGDIGSVANRGINDDEAPW